MYTCTLVGGGGGALPDNLGVKKVEGPSKCPSKWLIKLLSHKKKYVPQFLKQRDINSYYIFAERTLDLYIHI